MASVVQDRGEGSSMIPHKIIGTGLQAVTCQIAPGQTVYSEPGKFLWKTQNVTLETHLSAPGPAGGSPGGGGLLGRALDVGKRVLAGERLALEHFTAVGGNGLVGFAGIVPGEIRVLELDGPGWLTEKSAFVAAESSVRFDIAFTGLRAGLRGGEGFVLEHFTGAGSLIIAAAGSFLELDPSSYGGTIQVHTGSLVAFQDTLTYDVARVGSLGTQTVMNAALGDGSTVATISGQGTVIVGTVNLASLAATLAAHDPAGGGSAARGGVQGGLKDLF